MQRLLSKKQTNVTKQAYRWPFQLHGMIGPSCAIADVRGDQATVWSGCQGPFRIRASVASLLKIPEKNVRVIYRDGLGLLWPLSNDDSAEDAALLSRAVGAPVRIQWSRHDEHGWEPKGPAQTQTLKAGVDEYGQNYRLGIHRLQFSLDGRFSHYVTGVGANRDKVQKSRSRQRQPRQWRNLCL